MTYCISVKKLIVQTKIGCQSDERAKAQNIGVSINASFDARAAMASDEINDAVDYMTIADIAKDVAGQKERKLLETLAKDISVRVFEASSLVEKIEISLEKYSTVQDCAYVGFACTLDRETLQIYK